MIGRPGRFKSGWIRLDRRCWLEDIGDDPILFWLWSGFLAMANLQNTKIKFNGQQVTLHRGELVCSYRNLAQKAEVAPTTLRRKVLYLVDSGRIETRSGREGTIVSVINFDIYQTPNKTVEHDPKRERNATATPPQRHRTPIEQYNNITVNPGGDSNKWDLTTDRIDAACKQYPNQLSLGSARNRMPKVISGEDDYRDLLQAVFNYNKSKPFSPMLFVNFLGDYQSYVNKEFQTVDTRIKNEAGEVFKQSWESEEFKLADKDRAKNFVDEVLKRGVHSENS